MPEPVTGRPMRLANGAACHALSVDDFHKLGEIGVLRDEDRVELIEGVLIDMPPIGSRHASVVNRFTNRLAAALSGHAIVSVRNPVILGASSEVQPHVALLRHRDDFYANAHPTPADVLLVIEVADTSLPFDRNVKVPLYARHGIPEVWLVTPRQRQVEVFRRPTGEGYGETLRPAETEALAPLLLPEVSVNGTDLWRWSP